MKPTPRQQVFLRQLHTLCQEQESPVHYSLLASRLGVNRFSAYDMLKVLQNKGWVASHYRLDGKHTGPGRSSVHFSLTAQALAYLGAPHPESGSLATDNWTAYKSQILNRMRQAHQDEERLLLVALLEELPTCIIPQFYCAQMIAVLVLNLERIRSKVLGVNPYQALRVLTTDGDAGLGVLAGLSLGSALAGATSRNDRLLVEQLYCCIQQYQANLHTLNAERKQQLSEFLDEVIGVIAGQRPH